MGDRVHSNLVNVDEDEGIADLSEIESTASLRSSLFEYAYEHGRTWDKDGAYHRPNDDEELDRLDIMNELLSIVMDGELAFAPIGPTPHRILDIGAGTGIWCINMGDKYPTAEIIGVDINATMATLVPPNVRFEIDNVEQPWTFHQPFDFIHSRYMAGSIADWPKLMRQCFEHTKPGGWVEFQDFDIDYYSQDGTLTAEHALCRWLDTAHETVKTTGRTLRPGKYLEQWVRDQGFINVQVVRSPLPVGPWPKDKKLKRIGLFNWTQLWEGLSGMSYRLYVDILGWKREDVEVLLMEVRNVLKNPKIHPLFDLYTVWGEKPL